MSAPSFTLDQTRLGIFDVCANQERTLIARAVARQSSSAAPPSLIRFGFQLEGQSDCGTVEAALSRFVERHPALRSSFAENILLPHRERHERIEAFARTGVFEPGLFVQQVHEKVVPPIIALDWTNMPQCERDHALRSLLRSEDRRSFNDSDRSRVRALYIRTGVDRASLILTFDHLVFDGYSGFITRRELESLLSGRSDVDTSTSPETEVCGFPGFAAWQNRALRTAYFQSSIAFWRNQWSRFARYRVSYEDLPFSRSVPQQPDHTFATEYAVLNESESLALKTFAGNAKTTVFATSLTALARVLSEYAGRSSVVIWSHLLNRVQPGTLTSVGYYSNTHILGIDLPREATGRELIHRVGNVISSALVHQELPLQFLWRTLKCVPMYFDTRVLLDYRALPPRTADASESSAINVERLVLPDPMTPRFSNLGIHVTDRGDTIDISAVYWTARFSQSAVKGLLQELRLTVLDLVTNPDAPYTRQSRMDRAPQSRMEEFLLLDSTCIPLP